jgi:hypothetical protein
MNAIIEEIMADVQTKGREISLLISELSEFEDTYDSASTSASTDDRTVAAAFRDLVETLVEAESVIHFYNKKIRFEGYPNLQPNGRYTADGKELSSGSVIEVLDDVWGDGKSYQWRRTHIEYDNGYYAAGFAKQKLDELRVRVR